VKEETIPIYRDGRHYDLLYESAYPQFWIELAQEYGGPVLELACGTGAKAIPLAQSGLDVTGIDSSDAMLTEARRKAAAANVAVTWHQADMRSFQLGKSYPLILLLANSICHLLTYGDLEACLASVKAHLAPGGRFIVRVFVPNLAYLCKGADAREPFGSYSDPDSGEAVVITNALRYDAATQIRHNQLFYKSGDRSEVAAGDLSMRMYFPQELDALFHYNGFVIEHKYGDTERSPFGADSTTQIFILARRLSERGER
jgi:SAM-dependent methyltransferase